MSKKLTFLLITVLVLLVLVVVWLLSQLQESSTISPALSPYSAVYLSTGDIYFGELSWFPKPHLKNAWFIERSVDAENQAQLSVAPLSSVFWGPGGEMSLNPDSIIFSVRLRSDSEVVKLISSRNGVSLPGDQNP